VEIGVSIKMLSNGNNATKLNIKNTLYPKKRVFKLYNMFGNYTFIIF